MIEEEQARDIIQKSPIFHSHWSSKCETWFQMWKAVKNIEPTSLLNIGVGPPKMNGTTKWVNLLKKVFPSIKIEHLEIDKKNIDGATIGEKIHQGDVRQIDKAFPPNSFDVIFWCQGPEHIKRDEWAETFAKLESLAEVVILQCPWGSWYNGDPGHVSPSIVEGELEAHGYVTQYNGKKDTNDAGIIAYKVRDERI